MMLVSIALSESPTFVHCLLGIAVGQNQFFDAACDVTGQEPICLDAKLMVALKLIVFGGATLAWQD